MSEYRRSWEWIYGILIQIIHLKYSLRNQELYKLCLWSIESFMNIYQFPYGDTHSCKRKEEEMETHLFQNAQNSIHNLLRTPTSSLFYSEQKLGLCCYFQGMDNLFLPCFSDYLSVLCIVCFVFTTPLLWWPACFSPTSAPWHLSFPLLGMVSTQTFVQLDCLAPYRSCFQTQPLDL